MTRPDGSDVGGEKAPLEAGGSSESEVVVAEVAPPSASCQERRARSVCDGVAAVK